MLKMIGVSFAFCVRFTNRGIAKGLIVISKLLFRLYFLIIFFSFSCTYTQSFNDILTRYSGDSYQVVPEDFVKFDLWAKTIKTLEQGLSSFNNQRVNLEALGKLQGLIPQPVQKLIDEYNNEKIRYKDGFDLLLQGSNDDRESIQKALAAKTKFETQLQSQSVSDELKEKVGLIKSLEKLSGRDSIDLLKILSAGLVSSVDKSKLEIIPFYEKSVLPEDDIKPPSSTTSASSARWRIVRNNIIPNIGSPASPTSLIPYGAKDLTKWDLFDITPEKSEDEWMYQLKAAETKKAANSFSNKVNPSKVDAFILEQEKIIKNLGNLTRGVIEVLVDQNKNENFVKQADAFLTALGTFSERVNLENKQVPYKEIFITLISRNNDLLRSHLLLNGDDLTRLRNLALDPNLREYWNPEVLDKINSGQIEEVLEYLKSKPSSSILTQDEVNTLFNNQCKLNDVIKLIAKSSSEDLNDDEKEKIFEITDNSALYKIAQVNRNAVLKMSYQSIAKIIPQTILNNKLTKPIPSDDRIEKIYQDDLLVNKDAPSSARSTSSSRKSPRFSNMLANQDDRLSYSSSRLSMDDSLNQGKVLTSSFSRVKKQPSEDDLKIVDLHSPRGSFDGIEGGNIKAIDLDQVSADMLVSKKLDSKDKYEINDDDGIDSTPSILPPKLGGASNSIAKQGPALVGRRPSQAANEGEGSQQRPSQAIIVGPDQIGGAGRLDRAANRALPSRPIRRNQVAPSR